MRIINSNTTAPFSANTHHEWLFKSITFGFQARLMDLDANPRDAQVAGALAEFQSFVSLQVQAWNFGIFEGFFCLDFVNNPSD